MCSHCLYWQVNRALAETLAASGSLGYKLQAGIRKLAHVRYVVVLPQSLALAASVDLERVADYMDSTDLVIAGGIVSRARYCAR